MNRVAFGLTAVAVVTSAGLATAQPTGRAFATPPDWAGHPPPVGDLFGYSPLVRSIDPFPTRSSGYAYSMFLPRVGGKRLSWQPAPVSRQPLVIHSRPETAPILIIPTWHPIPVLTPVPTAEATNAAVGGSGTGPGRVEAIEPPARVVFPGPCLQPPLPRGTERFAAGRPSARNELP